MRLVGGHGSFAGAFVSFWGYGQEYAFTFPAKRPFPPPRYEGMRSTFVMFDEGVI